jgi:hypothetical protein
VEAYAVSKGALLPDTQDVLALLAAHFQFGAIGHLLQKPQEALQRGENPGELRPDLRGLAYGPLVNLQLAYFVYELHIRHDLSANRTSVLIIREFSPFVKMDEESLRYKQKGHHL